MGVAIIFVSPLWLLDNGKDVLEKYLREHGYTNLRVQPITITQDMIEHLLYTAQPIFDILKVPYNSDMMVCHASLAYVGNPASIIVVDGVDDTIMLALDALLNGISSPDDPEKRAGGFSERFLQYRDPIFCSNDAEVLKIFGVEQ